MISINIYQSDPQPVEYHEMDVRADADAIERLSTMLGKVFKYKEDYASLEL